MGRKKQVALKTRPFMRRRLSGNIGSLSFIFRKENEMINVSELKTACERIEREYGSDSKVVIQMRNENGSLMKGKYLRDMFINAEGTLFLTNHKFKHGSCE